MKPQPSKSAQSVGIATGQGTLRAALCLNCACLFVMTCLAASSDPDLTPAERLVSSQRPLIIAHRGYSAFAPENTLLAFDHALSAGADLVELDYHHTADGVPIVIHDANLDRTTDAIGRWGGKALPVAARTHAELTTLDAGQWFRTPTPGQKLPSLTDALDFIQPRGVTLIERKSGDAATLVRILQERSLLNRVVVQAFDWKYLEDYHRLEPRQVLGALGPPSSRDGRKLTDQEKILDEAWIEEVKAVGAGVIVWNRQVNAAAISKAHEQGLRVWIYTINDPLVAADLLALGVDGLITDNPAIVWRVLALKRQ